MTFFQILSMTKPKYCSWDVRDLAADYNWTEISDERDITNLVFQQQVKTELITINVKMESGWLYMYTENNECDRYLLHFELCLDFSDIEKIFSGHGELNSQIKELRMLSRAPKQHSGIKANTAVDTKPVSNCGANEFDMLQSIIHKWDIDEK